MGSIKMVIKSKFLWMIKLLRSAKVSYKNFVGRERKITLGNEFPDTIFYVIRWGGDGTAMAGLVNIVLSRIEYALLKGYVPVVDLCNYQNFYISKKEIGKTNVWEWFFEQPCGYSLGDIKEGKNIILSPLYNVLDTLTEISLLDEYQREEKSQGQILYKKYIRFNEVALKKFNKRRKMIISENNTVLAVKLRGTDYALGCLGHPKIIPIEDILNDVNQILAVSNYDKIFLSCEDENLAVIFRYEFGSKVVMNEEEFLTNEKGAILSVRHGREAYDELENYLSTLWIASRCEGIFGVACGGTMLIWHMMDEENKFFKVKNIGNN